MVPNGWSEKKLGSFMQFKNGVNADKDHYGSGYKFVNVMDVFRNDRLTEKNIQGKVNLSQKQLIENQLQYGDVLFNRTSETFDEIAMSAVYLDDSIATFGGFVIRGRCANELISPEFSVYAFQAKEIRSQAIRFGQGAVRANIGQKDLSKIKMSLPPLKEQVKIAKILSTWDKAISTTERLIDNSKQQKKALMQQLLTGKKRLLDDSGKPFEGEWEEVKVGSLITKHSEKTNRSGQYPVLTSSRKGIMFQSHYYNNRDVASEDNTGYNVVPRGFFTYRHMSDDLVFKFNINTICDRGIVSTLYPVFAAKENKVIPYFLQLILNEGSEFKRFSLAQKQGGSRTYMYLSKLNDLKIYIPNISEQQKIASVLTNADKEIELLEQQLTDLKQEKKALMQQLLTGKRRVKVDDEAVA